MLSATTSKVLLSSGTSVVSLSALELTCIQMFVAGTCAAVSSVFFNRTVKKLAFPDGNALMRISALAAVFSVGFITLNLAYTSMSASLANTLRAMEPLNSLFLTWLLTKDGVSSKLVMAVLPIVFGACLASYGNLEFTLTGLFYVQVANFCFAYRTMQYRDIRKDYGIDHASLFSQTCILSALFIAAGLFAISKVRVFSLAGLLFTAGVEYHQTLLLNGLTFFLYLQLSFATLSYITVVTHAVLNSFRRPAVILFDVFKLGTTLSTINAVGITIACVGVTAYSLLKVKMQGKTKGG